MRLGVFASCSRAAIVLLMMIATPAVASPPVKDRIAVVVKACTWDDKIGFTRYAELCKESSDFYFAQPEDTADELLPFLSSTDRRERFLAAWRLHPASAAKLGERLLKVAEAEQDPAVARLLLPALASITRAPWIDRIVEVVRTKAAGDGASDYVEMLDGLATAETRATVDGVLDRLAKDRGHRGHLAALQRAPCATANAFLDRTASDAEIVAATTRVLADEAACAVEAKRAVAEVKRRGALPMRDLAHLGTTLDLTCGVERANGRSVAGFKPVLRELVRWLRAGLAGKREPKELARAKLDLELGYLDAGLKACGDR